MVENKKYLINPDIHGRTFWKNNIDTTKYEKIIFLGDYLDPYPFEGITEEDAIENFKEIIEFKKNNKDKVILLLGNHDIYYYLKEWGPSRYSRKHAKTIENLFEYNRDLFQIAYETKYDLFTHAGIIQGWYDKINQICKENEQEEYSLDDSNLNLLLNNNDKTYCRHFLDVSRTRGGREYDGSCLWADVTEHDKNEKYQGKYQIFGHTLQLDLKKYYETYNHEDIADGKEIITDKYAMLDCRHQFEYTVNVSDDSNKIQREFDKLD